MNPVIGRFENRLCGIVVIDFMEEEISRQLISLNFGKEENERHE